METKLVAHFTKEEGTACFAPYVDITVSNLIGRKSKTSFKARIDTGADVTCVPMKQAKHLMPLLLGRPMLIRTHAGQVKREQTYLMAISIQMGDGKYKSFRPGRGVLLTDSAIGLIGMDILPAFEMKLADHTLTLIPAK